MSRCARAKEILAKANVKEMCRIAFVASYTDHAILQRDITQLYDPGPGPSTMGSQHRGQNSSTKQ
jgi:hypothetical protein